MNYLKKKLKPLTSGLSSSAASNKHHNHDQLDLESDLYDDYVVEAPPHPSELLALGVNPAEIDANDPDKLRELYRKVKEEGREKGLNSVLLAKQRQKEDIEERKKTREEWKFFDSLSARVEEAVKNSQKTLEQLKETSALDKLNEPDYELRSYTEDELKSTVRPGLINLQDQLVNIAHVNNDTEAQNKQHESREKQEQQNTQSLVKQPEEKPVEDLDPFGFGLSTNSSTSISAEQPKADLATGSSPINTTNQADIVEELFEDLGIDLRPSDLRNQQLSTSGESSRRRKNKTKSPPIDDPFDTSFVETVLEKPALIEETLESRLAAQYANVDPFDTSFVDL